MKILLSFLFIAASTFAFSQTAEIPDTSLAKNVVFEKVEVESTFPGGEMAWRKYLEKHLNPNVPVEHGAPAGTFTVVVQFIVDKQGAISEVKALINHGYGMEEEVLKIVSKGPKWVPAMQNNKVVKAYRKQPVTFVVAPDGFDIRVKNGSVLYTESNNEVIIKIDKVRNENLMVTISQGTITYDSENDYTVKVNNPGRAIITIYNKKKGMKEIGAAIFDVRKK